MVIRIIFKKPDTIHKCRVHKVRPQKSGPQKFVHKSRVCKCRVSNIPEWCHPYMDKGGGLSPYFFLLPEKL